MKRFLLALLLFAAVGALLWWTLREEEPGPPPTPPGPSEPEAAEMTHLQASEVRHKDPWPFGEFLDDLRAVRNPTVTEAHESEADILVRMAQVYSRKVNLDMKQATVNEVLRELDRQLAPHGVRILWKDPGPLPDTRFDIRIEDQELTYAIDALRAATVDQVKYILTLDGLWIGTEGTIIEGQIEARENQAKRGEPKPGESAEVLDVTFRPDFQRATIGAVVRSVKAQTGVDIVVGDEIWYRPKLITWRDDEPQPLRTVCVRLTQVFGGSYRVRGGRIFLFEP